MSSDFKVLVTDTLTTDALACLLSAFPNQVLKSDSPSPVKTELAEARYMVIRSRTNIRAEILNQAPNLKLIVTATSGFDHIDLNACQKRGIHVLHTPEANASSVCELTFALILSLLRHLNEMKTTVKVRQWKNALTWGEELQGQNLGIIGLGRIGSRVAKIASAFGMLVSALDPYQPNEVFERLGVERLGLTEILMSSDILSLHIPYTKKTHHLINHRTLSHMSQQAILINTSRGSIVAETELVEALEMKRLRGACLDVFEREPIAHTSKLLKMPNVVLSCHVGAYTEQAFDRASKEAVKKIITFHQSDKVSDSLPPAKAWYIG